MSKVVHRTLSVLVVLAVIGAGCSSSDDDADASPSTNGTATTAVPDGAGPTATTGTTDVDYEALGLWDDGACDDALDPLVIGIMTVFESPVISLIDQVWALEAAADAFNARGGANGACIRVVGCDDGADFEQALRCAREMEDAGVVATVNDQGSTANAEVSEAMAAAGIPRIGANVINTDWDDENAYPIDASGTGSTFMMPQALVAQGIDEIGLVRVDLPQAGAIVGVFADLFTDASFPVDVPVPAGTTDYTQFVLAAEDGGVDGVALLLGEQEAVQVIGAARDLGSELPIAASLGSFSYANVADFGDIADQMVFVWPFPPATADVPVYDVLRADLAASGEDALQTENLKTSPMRSWIALYALLWMIRDSGLTEFSGDAITELLNATDSVPMLGLFGGEDWIPALDREGLWRRAGVDRWTTYEWDPDAEWDGNAGNFVLRDEISFDEVMCGSPFGAETC